MAGGAKRLVRRSGTSTNSTRHSRRVRPLRVLMVIDQFNIGGTETHVYALTRELLRQGVEVAVAGKQGKLLGRFAGLGIPCYELDFVLSNHEYNADDEPRHRELLASIIKQQRIDLVHVHQFPSGYPAFAAAESANVPFVFTLHGSYYDELFLRTISGRARCRIICVSPSLQQHMRRLGIGCDLIANGIEPGDYAAYRDLEAPYRAHVRSRLGIPAEAKVIMYASRMSWEKAEICEQLIHGMSSLRLNGHTDCHLMIIGGGKQDRLIEQLAREHNELFGATFIHYCGEMDNIHTYYAASDLVIGTGRIALEAMACCRPLIAVGSRGYLGLIRSEVWPEAWRTWFGDHDADRRTTRRRLTSDMKEAILMSGSRLHEIVTANLRHVSSTFPIARTAKETLHLYERLTRTKDFSTRRTARKTTND